MIPEAALAVALHLSPIHKAAVIPQAWRPFAACVLKRESGGTLNNPKSGLRARNQSGSSGSGRWQFLDTAWRVRGGLHWMVWQRLVDHGMPRPKAKRIRERLAATPIYLWRSEFQDAGFVAVVTASPNGWRHWSLAGSPCNRKAPR